MSVVAAAQSCSSFLPTRRGMGRLSRPGASVGKFPAQRKYAAATIVPATRFEPGTARLRIQRAINYATTPHNSNKPINLFISDVSKYLCLIFPYRLCRTNKTVASLTAVTIRRTSMNIPQLPPDRLPQQRARNKPKMWLQLKLIHT